MGSNPWCGLRQHDNEQPPCVGGELAACGPVTQGGFGTSGCLLELLEASQGPTAPLPISKTGTRKLACVAMQDQGCWVGLVCFQGPWRGTEQSSLALGSGLPLLCWCPALPGYTPPPGTLKASLQRGCWETTVRGRRERKPHTNFCLLHPCTARYNPTKSSGGKHKLT